MNATAKFYTGFFVALALLVAVSGFVGYGMGGRRAVTQPAAAVLKRDVDDDRVCLRDVRARAGAAGRPAETFARALLAANDCAKRDGLPFLTASDFSR